MQEEMGEQQISLKDYIRVLYRGRWIIAISFLVVVAFTVYFTFTMQPVYEASALILIKDEGGVQQQVFEVSSFMKQETKINNHIEILKSRTLAENVIRRLEESSYADSLFFFGNTTNRKSFSPFKWIVSLFRKEKSVNDNDNEALFNLLVREFREAVTVEPKRDTDMLELKVQAPSAFEASFVANTWMYAYRDLDISDSRGEVSEVRMFLEEKLIDIQKELTASEEALKEYKENQNVTEMSAETQQTIIQLAEFETQYQAAETDLKANEKRLAYLRKQLGENKSALITNTLSSPVIEALQAQMAQLIGEIAAYEQQLKGAGLSTENNLKLRDMENRRKGIQEKIVQEMQKNMADGSPTLNPMATSETLISSILEIEAENTALVAKANALKKIVQGYNRELNSLPEKSQTLARLQREALVNDKIYMMMREKYEENRIAEAGQIGSVRIVDVAQPPKDPIKPKKKMNLLLGIMVGLGLGIGLTFLREYMDTSLKSIEDVERMGFTVMGSIPFITTDKLVRHIKGVNGETSRIQSRLVTHFAPKSPISEAYRTLRTNIRYANLDHPVKTLMVTSSGPGEGKSTSVANLAITFAQMGSNTLLVDTDLRRPVQHGIFGLKRENGLSNVLIGKLPFEKAIKKTKIDRLQLITCGTLPPNPSEMLSSKSMEKFVKDAGSMFDLVLFDSPPIIAVTDAAILATKVGGVLLVIKSGEAVKDAVERSQILMNNVNAKILGALLNGINVDNMYGSYYYYYQQYYYGDGKKRKRMAKTMV